MGIEETAKLIIDYGFAGMCAALLGFIFWLVRRLISILQQTNEIIANNTEAIRQVNKGTEDILLLLRELHNKLISRPCIAREEGK